MKPRALPIAPLSLALGLISGPLLTAQSIPSKPAAESRAETGSYTVQKGDSLASIARKTGTNAGALAKTNKIKNPAMIRIGQVLKLPNSKSPKPSTPKEEKGTAKTETKPEPKTETKPETAPAAAPKTASTKEYTIQSGDTLYSIARKQGISVATLKKANPSVDPSNLKIGQALKVQGSASSEPETAAKPAPAEPKENVTKPVSKPTATEKVAEIKEPAVKEPVQTAHTTAVVHEPKAKPPEPTVAPAKEPEKSATPKVVSVTIDQEITFGEFAAQHNITPEELIALNGFKASELPVGTVLAKGSELYVPSKDQ